MIRTKKITAGIVALALGTSALIAPAPARALPAEFTSPPGLHVGYESGCKNTLSHSVERNMHSRQLEVSHSIGLTIGSYRFEDWLNPKEEVYVWATLTPEGQRQVRYSGLDIELRNISTENVDWKIETVTGTHTFKDELTGNTATVTTTGKQNVQFTKGTVAPGAGGVFEQTVQLSGLAPEGKTQTWMWKVTLPFDKGDRNKFQTQVRPVLKSQTAPWPIETDNCQPMLPAGDGKAEIIADGNEYLTEITVKNAAEDFERLFGTVSFNGAAIKDAKVRVDKDGKVYVTLPKGSTGQEDNGKPAKVDVQILANPREETDDSKYESYSKPQVLRVENPQRPGTTNGFQPEYKGSVPVAKFKPEYKDPKTVQPGKDTTVELTLKDKLRGKAIKERTEFVFKGFTVTGDAPKDKWTVSVDPKTGNLKVVAPQEAKPGDKVTVTVEARYPDGSKDTLKPVVTVVDFDNNQHDPNYGEKADKPGKTVTLEVGEKNGKTFPGGTTFVISGGQNFGDWKPTVDEKTGTITVQIPEGAKPGDSQTILIDVTYPDGTKDEKVPAKVIVLNTPGYGEEIGRPKDTVKIPHTGTVVPGTTFEIAPNQPGIDSWNPTINPTTGEITVVIPEGTAPGTVQPIKVLVKDPNNPNTPAKPDEVTATVKVFDGPQYPDKTTRPGTTVIVTPVSPTVPGGTTFEIKPGQDFGGWKPTVNPNTGEITVVVPPSAKNGDEKQILIDVSYPNGSKDTVPAKVVVVDNTIPGGGGNGDNTNVIVVPTDPQDPNKGTTVTVNITIPGVNPGSGDFKFEIDNSKLPAGWTVVVDPKTGELKITIPDGTKPGTYNIPVTVTYPDGTKKDFIVPIVIGGSDKPAEQPSRETTPGSTIVIINPGGATGGSTGGTTGGTNSNPEITLPEGWTYTRDGDKITINVPKDAKPGTYPVTVGGTTINFEVKDGRSQGNLTAEPAGEGSSEDTANKCFSNALASPLFYLLPLGLLGAVAGEIARPYLGAIDEQLKAMGWEFNQSLGFGQRGVERPENEHVNEIAAQFGLMLTDSDLQRLGTAAAVTLGLAAMAGLWYDWCTSELGEAKTSIGYVDLKTGESSRSAAGNTGADAKQREGSSSEGSSDKAATPNNPTNPS